ncbi:NUDIX hydrolase [Beutenbergia cavernae DSM 12333]|uniref:NUDIX hydrolase n=1 Tax=Beutenbergia cavernae (strain ATCC BAA-8 / DSM 12333 / CCUG 43141 / JCM 11478 / NBRC 16432 / NCIMB 13614 / HKI 0122) TaxID=471853 RepID=C5C0Z2_BEUC1|nr:NUDIX domain-containing protein [Beutenbergia cavernae]ACQ79396.1 NUDIX hydrolase [Beutenbergia cavernae DSM 12333]
MTSSSDLPTPGHPSDAWVHCACGERHWGTHGAAGLLLTDGGRVVLQHRAAWSHHGDTWGVPGGALLPGEGAPAGALREAREEAGIDAGAVRLLATSVLQHPDWSYTTLLATAGAPVRPRATDPESVEVAWVACDDVAGLPLHPGFGLAWPQLRDMLVRRPLLVVDAANVVGSVPDGWWRDRRAATARLRDGLADALADGLDADLLGLPGQRWWPDVVLVVEGAARGVPAPDERTRPWRAGSLTVVSAAGSGDDAVVRVVEEALSVSVAGSGDAVEEALSASAARSGDADDAAPVGAARRPADVTVATADRGLLARLPPGVGTASPRAVRGLGRPA